jgi:hypothetical protein
MKGENRPFRDSAGNNPIDVLQNLVGLFESKGWLNQTLRIRHRDRRYRICCSEKEFFAYRINDHCGVLPGFSCWPVCIVSEDRIVEDSEMSAFSSMEPTAQDWLFCITRGDFEII